MAESRLFESILESENVPPCPLFDLDGGWYKKPNDEKTNLLRGYECKDFIKYLDYQNKIVDDSQVIESLIKAIGDKKVLLILPGRTVVSQRQRIVDYISEEHPVVIGVNAWLDGFDYDYLFFSNSVRYDYAKDIYANVRENYGSQIYIFNTRIPLSVKAAEASAEGISIFRHCPKNKVALAYQKLTKEVLNHEN
jgi:hypothetical protein